LPWPVGGRGGRQMGAVATPTEVSERGVGRPRCRRCHAGADEDACDGVGRGTGVEEGWVSSGRQWDGNGSEFGQQSCELVAPEPPRRQSESSVATVLDQPSGEREVAQPPGVQAGDGDAAQGAPSSTRSRQRRRRLPASRDGRPVLLGDCGDVISFGGSDLESRGWVRRPEYEKVVGEAGFELAAHDP
jgi:hypothetical protein